MYNQLERELKLLVSKEVFDKIVKSYEFTKPIIQTNTYYDTPNHYIKNKKGAMRIRTINSQHIFTLKIRKDEYTHYEYEKTIDTNDIHKIQDPEILNWLHTYDIDLNVDKVTEFTTKRYIYEFEDGELCADETDFGKAIDYEIEYEYKKEHDGILFFNKILSEFHMNYTKNCSSKIARAINYQNL